MAKLEVKTKVKVYEKDGKELGVNESDEISVEGHWNRRNFVILNINGKKVTVVADHLNRAVQNATNQPV